MICKICEDSCVEIVFVNYFACYLAEDNWAFVESAAAFPYWDVASFIHKLRIKT